MGWQVQWKWGPVTSYKLPLEEIDSASASLFDVMELVLMPDAKKSYACGRPTTTTARRRPARSRATSRVRGLRLLSARAVTACV
jgi:hypothetical protein